MTSSELSYNLAGHVRHQGLPVAGVMVRIYDLFGNSGIPSTNEVSVAQHRTGTRGEFTFAIAPGLYRVDVEPAEDTRLLRTSIPEVKVSCNTTCNINLSTGSILSGAVRTADGAVVVGCEVVALGIEPTSYQSVGAVNAKGIFNIVLPKGKFHLSSRPIFPFPDDPRYYNKETGQPDKNLFLEPFLVTSVSVRWVQKDAEINLSLPELKTFSGEVKDAFGHPLRGATVTVTPATTKDNALAVEMKLNAKRVTDRQGKFNILVEPGLYNVNIEPDDAAFRFGTQENNLRIFEDTHKRFTLQEGFRVRGNVTFNDEPLADCLVRMQSADAKTDLMMRTDAEGQFSASVPGGDYKIVVAAHPKNSPPVMINGHEYAGLAPWSRMVVVGGDTHVAVKLQQGSTVFGRVCDEYGQARPGVRVSVFPDADNKMDYDRLSHALTRGITDGEGKYCLFLAPGKYWLVVHKDIANAKLLEISDEPVSMDVAWRGWCQLRFELIGDDGRNVPRCHVSYRPYGEAANEGFAEDDMDEQAPSGYVFTDGDGKCQVTVPTGVYTLEFKPPIDGSYEPKSIRQLSISSDISRRIILSMKPEAADLETASQQSELG